MKVEYINPFVTSITSVFATMLDCRISRGKPFVKEGFQPHYEVSGIIRLSGKATGTVVLSLETAVALAATEAMLLERPPEINSDVVDAVGELTNIVAGGAKAKLEHFALSASLPSVIIGREHTLEFPSNVTPISIPFDCPWGGVILDVGLVENPAQDSGSSVSGELAAAGTAYPGQGPMSTG